ncbi:MAG: copper homeostasis protein CutC [Bacteroidales bacterium]|nr:copper homeostasis protein CutC [Bacteroidales bacterium]MCB9028939.1 copper homeostasis protein CutC [Bacteroidales bacterium]MDD3736340.1 copper homeostasis protein CutC [Bacteroidales bacterium]NLD64166.1 copper homeostasis protein CutC [Bacteroidales bacterium]HNT92894.1 copper homeostasis protein CutC [Bacteroidales bacterium]
MSLVVEICVDSVESAIIAEAAGAGRLELCSALAEGGVTPSAGLIESVRRNTGIRIHVLIRPRGGDFLYSDNEFSVMRRDIDTAGELGADGIVTGILNNDGTVDVERTALLAEYASPMSLTFHRAFDLCRDPGKGLEEVIATGAERLLTSGQAKNAIEGAPLIKALIKDAAGRLTIMPGGGIDEYNIALLAASTGAHEYHLSGRRQRESQMTFRRKGIYMGDPRLQTEYLLKSADAERISSVIMILRGIVF